MHTVNSLAIAAIATAAFSSCAAAFDASLNTNMAVYWGQGDGQQRLAHYCQDSSIDIIPIGFLNVFPDQAGGGYPGTNFANQCGNSTYKNLDGSSSPLLSDCPLIGPDIVTCQNAGKKILLSLGGAVPTNQEIKDDASAIRFANFLWNAFGPKDPSYTGPRPFGDAVVDGFDFDIESSLSKVSNAPALSRGYATVINTLRSFYVLEEKTYYISSAPQCVVPDVHLADAIEKSYFDFVFVQFYNTPECSARAFFDHTYGSFGGPSTDISFKKWVDFIRSSRNPHAKVYLGLPSSPAMTYDAKMYIEPSEVSQLISKFQCDYPDNFGGLMVFEATSSESNSIGGRPYVDVLKDELMSSNCAVQTSITSALPSPTSSSSVSSSMSTSSSTSASSSATATTSISSSSSGSSSVTSTTSTSSSSSGSSSVTSTTSTSSSSSGSSSVTSTTSTSSSQSSTSASSTSSSTGSTDIPTFASASLSVPSHTSGTGLWNSTTTPGPTPPLIPTGSAPFTRPSSSVTHNTTSFTKSIGTGGSAPIFALPTGVSASFSLSPGSSSNAPYPVSNNSTSQPTPTEGVVYTTEVITVTSCGPEVTSCPARLSTSIYPVTTSTHGHGTVISAGTSGNPPSVAASSSEASPPQGSSITQAVVTTEIVYTTLTTCPVTQTVTSSGRPVTQTTSTVSTIYSTSTSTICTRCIAPPTSSLAPTGTLASSTASAPVTKLTSSASSSSAAAPVASAPAATQAVVTTDIVYTTVTTCPVTKTLTSSGSVIVQTTLSVSTVISTSVSTVCTQCIAPTTTAPLSTNSGVSVPPQSPSSAPASVGPQSSSTSGNSPVQASSSVITQPSRGTKTTSLTSTATTAASSQAQGSVAATSNGPSPSTASVVTIAISPIPLNPSQTAKAQSSASTVSGMAPVASISAISLTSTASGTAPVASVSLASTVSAGSSSSVALVSTMIIVPVPMNPGQTAASTKPSQSVRPINAAPFPSGNSTSPLGASAGVSASSVGKASASSTKTLAANPAQFTGAASKMPAGVTEIVVIIAAAAFIL